MTTKMVRIVTCDRCRDEAKADTATSIPANWATMTSGAATPKVWHLCPACLERALAVERELIRAEAG